MPALTLTNVSYAIGDRRLLNKVSITIQHGECAGIVGRNGAGKSTLFKLVTGEKTPDSGEVVRARGNTMAVVGQDPVFSGSMTLLEEAAQGLEAIQDLQQRLDDLYEQIANIDDAAPDAEIDRDGLLRQAEHVQHELEQRDGYATQHRVEIVLQGVGFTQKEFSLPVEGLSGGQRSRLALSKALLADPDLLLLDEPTNHLDIEGRQWLENFLSTKFQGSVLLISHDRYLLDHCVRRIIEVDNGGLIEYPGSYTKMVQLRAERKQLQMHAYEKQQEKFARESEYIRRFKAGQRARQAKGRESRLTREMEEQSIERPLEASVLHFVAPPAPRSGDIVATLNNGSVWYDVPADDSNVAHRRTLFEQFNVKISRGERWGVIGANGAGKSTLVRCLLGEQQLDEGNSRIGSNVEIGHYKQIDATMDLQMTVREYLQREYRLAHDGKLLSEQEASDLAGAFLFSGRDQQKPMGALSGGERSRARLASLMVSGKNLLVLDEPTNHLDIPSCERLEQALRPTSQDGKYDHTLILISHDRALLDALCDQLIVFEHDGRVRVFHGNYSQWLESSGQPADAGVNQTSHQSTPKQTAQPQPAAEKPKAKPNGESKRNPLSWMRDEQLDEKIEELSALVKSLDEKMSDPKVYTDASLCKQVIAERETAKESLDQHEAEWLRRADG
ncbi:MAG: ABC-F family ATP-binding cassette domain-containing protein [Phycisphaeraceae bacterium]|nr:ABC-F family ATP-binding cassette domain-containing protein [Phycisphaerales bacterium]MCB9861440.1 ABC-F family ATP-binding cassette domain-containing protein [Phycisphaeraceae bacterium]